MRPELLNPFFAPLGSLPGIGPKLEAIVAKLLGDNHHEDAGRRIIDLLWHFPRDVIDRRKQPSVHEIEDGMVTLKLVVGKYSFPPRSSRAPARITCYDDTGEITLVYFHARQDYLSRLLPIGETVYISGMAEKYGGKVQIVHPDYVVPENKFSELPLIEAVYPLTKGVSGKVLRKSITAAIKRLPNLNEWQDEAWHTQQNWPSFTQALSALHSPQALNDVAPDNPARQRIAYDEFLANLLSMALVRRHMVSSAGRAFKSRGLLRKKILDMLPYALTAAQADAIRTIIADMKSDKKMVRLLQGDVGAGKTIVAMSALAHVVEAGYQGALMAPTELLARQHYQTLKPICDAIGISCNILTAKEKGAKRTALLSQLSEGECDILIGTHALLQDPVQFKDLGLSVIDEQHRFGVHQRLVLQEKGLADLLVMTATPIPRTLTLTHYGDMDIVRLSEKPPGRKPIETRVLPDDKTTNVIEGLKRALKDGKQAYWVCPLVEESDVLDITAVIDRYKVLEKVFPGRVGLVHGRMKQTEKNEIMRGFSDGKISILVATTVIEVGIDVPNASIMIVEHAERFGLAQLHQLRGRVGRGQDKSSCLLIYAGKLSVMARERLKIMRETEDGFLIAEEDMRLRGSGEMLGTRQSGAEGFKCAELPVHLNLLEAARDDTHNILSKDPYLSSERGQNLKVLLHIFERHNAIKLLRAG